MSIKRFFGAMGITVLVLLMVFGGWRTAQFLFGSNLSGDVAGMLDKLDDKKVNILCMGLDKDRTRADVIMLVSADPKLGTINLLSIPRDTRVQVGGKYIKINACMGYDRRETLMIEKVKEITGLPVHYYAECDFQGFRDVIDILGGVDFDVPQNMDYEDPAQGLSIHLKKGMQHLDGKGAEGVVRYRHSYAMGDYDRIKVQQDFIKALFEQKLKPQYITKAPELIREISESVTTNLTVADAIKYAGMLKKFTEDSLHTYSLPGESKTISGISYFLYDPEETDALIQSTFLSDGTSPSPSAGAAAATD